MPSSISDSRPSFVWSCIRRCPKHKTILLIWYSKRYVVLWFGSPVLETSLLTWIGHQSPRLPLNSTMDGCMVILKQTITQSHQLIKLALCSTCLTTCITLGGGQYRASYLHLFFSVYLSMTSLLSRSNSIRHSLSLFIDWWKHWNNLFSQSDQPWCMVSLAVINQIQSYLRFTHNRSDWWICQCERCIYVSVFSPFLLTQLLIARKFGIRPKSVRLQHVLQPFSGAGTSRENWCSTSSHVSSPPSESLWHRLFRYPYDSRTATIGLGRGAIISPRGHVIHIRSYRFTIILHPCLSNPSSDLPSTHYSERYRSIVWLANPGSLTITCAVELSIYDFELTGFTDEFEPPERCLEVQKTRLTLLTWPKPLQVVPDHRRSKLIW